MTFRAGDSSGDIHHRYAFWRLGAPSQVSHTAFAVASRYRLLSLRRSLGDAHVGTAALESLP
jgi:hypothetical protein